MHRSFKACIQPGRETKDREKMLQQKLAELSSHLQRLERCMAMIRAENDVLRKKQSDKRSLEQQVRVLRKRNSDLAAGSRRLEERVRSLQERAARNAQKTNPESQASLEVNARGRGQARQSNALYRRTVGSKDHISDNLRNKDQTRQSNTPYRRTVASKGHGIDNLSNRGHGFDNLSNRGHGIDNLSNRGHGFDNLSNKCQRLTDLLNNTPDRTLQNARHLEEQQEFIRIIKIAAKERLQLEHELANSRSSWGPQLSGPYSECLPLSRDGSLIRHKTQCQDKLARVLAEKQQLQHTIVCLREQVQGRQQNAEECTTLKLSLAAIQKEKEEAEEEAKCLRRRVHSLEHVVRDLQETAEHVGQLEKHRETALEQLAHRQTQLERLPQKSMTTATTHQQELSTLSQLLAQSEEKLRLEEESRLKLIQEVQRLQKEVEERVTLAAQLQQGKQDVASQHRAVSSQPVSSQPVSSQPVSSQPVSSQPDKGENREMEQEFSRTSWIPNEQSSDDNMMSLWAKNGPIQVYVAKYDYDPFQLSPNESPEAELPLTAGDFVLVAGDMDEQDGFFDGELIDGSQGLVPSNFIEKVKDEDLRKFHEVVLHTGSGGHRATTDSTNTINHPTQHSQTAEPSPVAESAPPLPTDLWLDKQLPDCVHLSWVGPDPSLDLQVHWCHVLVDGQVKAVVEGSDQTQVTLEGISDSQTCQLGIRCLSNRGQSADAQCAMLVGKDQTVEADTMLHSSPLLVELAGQGVSLSAGHGVFQSLDSVDGEEQRGLETDEEIEEAFREVEHTNEAEEELSESRYSDSSRTELSDIPEVEEDLVGSQDSQLNQAGDSQVATKSPESTTDRSAHSETDDQPTEFHSEKPTQFDGRPLAAPTPRTPTTVMQNHAIQPAVREGTEEENPRSTRSTPTNIYSEETRSYCEQPILDIHISRAFLKVDSTQQMNLVNFVHLVNMEGSVSDECIHSQGSHETQKTPLTFSDPAKLLSGNPNQDLVKETPTSKRTDNETQSGHQVVRLSTSSVRPAESPNYPGDISRELSPVVKANSVRLFIALYDYHPDLMSPNVDSAEEELSFREGQILKVFGLKDADGFYKGESNGRMGYIPCNLVCEVQIDDPKLRQQLLQDMADSPGEPLAGLTHSAAPHLQSGEPPVTSNGRSSVPTKDMPGRQMIALYDYNPQELSPNVDAELELPFTAGDIVTIYGDVDEDGFFIGEINDRHGLVPSNFLQPVPTCNYRHST